MYNYKELINIKSINPSFLTQENVAILSDNSNQFLNRCIRGYGIKKSIDLTIWNSPIDQIENQILNSKSEFNKKKFDYTIIFESSHSLLKKYNLTDSKESFSDIQFKRIKNLIARLLNSSQSKIILFNFYELNDKIFGNYSSKNLSSFVYHLRRINLLISEFCASISSISILDISSIQNLIGSKNMFDSSLYVNYGMVLNLDSLPIISKNIIDVIMSFNSVIKKCLIIDLDNTIWGGIIGDDGIEKIKLGNLGIGKSFVEFQQWIKKLKERGIIICICSKNDEEIAKEVFLNHPDMVLTLDDISVFVANWNSKVDNIKNIQKVLNIGFDSMVFLDDNPFERNSVKENIPMISVPNLPDDPSNYLSFLYEENLFETVSSSSLDKRRTKLYQEEFKRIKSKDEYTDLSDYMLSLNMMSRLESLNRYNIPRVCQLSQRSNQFNLRTIRYSEEDLFEIMKSDNKHGLVFDLKDKFGDHGIISFIILKMTSPHEVFIENWAMSCRVFDRGMEDFILNEIVDFVKKKGIKKIHSEYLSTKKNMIVKDLFSRLSFKKVTDFRYNLKLSNYKFLKSKIKRHNSESLS